jgi:hypothetical protein
MVRAIADLKPSLIVLTGRRVLRLHANRPCRLCDLSGTGIHGSCRPELDSNPVIGVCLFLNSRQEGFSLDTAFGMSSLHRSTKLPTIPQVAILLYVTISLSIQREAQLSIALLALCTSF